MSFGCHLRIPQRLFSSPTRGLAFPTPHARLSYTTSTRTFSSRPSSSPRQAPKRRLSTAAGVALAIAVPSTFYLVGSLYPPSTLTLLIPRKAPPPMRADTPEGKAYTEKLEQSLQALGIVQQWRDRVAAPDSEWYETRPAEEIMHDHSLTGSILRGPGMLAVPPIAFVKHNESEAVLILHLGRSLCGHDGIIHGGMLATVFDEALGRNALLNIPSHIGVTATLNIQYKKPTKADQFVVIKTKLDSTSGRKIYVSAELEDLDGQTLATASAMFVEPSYAKYMDGSKIAAAFGKPTAKILDTDENIKSEKH